MLAVSWAHGQCEVGKLSASDGAVADQFGFDTALDRNVAIVGSIRDDDNGEDAGAAYVFRFDGANWVREAKLLASDGESGDEFGISVGVSGNVAIVGTRGSGAAYVFHYRGSRWHEQARLEPTDPGGVTFGTAVAIHDNVVVVGRTHDDENGSGSGSVYVFEYDGTRWVERTKILPSDGAAFDQFGYAVYLNESGLVVGAQHDSDNGTQSGSAYVFRRSPDGWLEEAKFIAPDGGINDSFGKSVAIDGNAVVIGANAFNDDGVRSGAAYAYRRSGAMWRFERKLVPPAGEQFDWFGVSVALNGDLAMIGASGDDSNGISSGAVYVYRYRGTDWRLQAKLLASDGAPGDRLGYAIAASGKLIIAGARTENDDTAEGSAYVFRVTGCSPDLSADSEFDELDLANLVRQWGSCGEGCSADLEADGMVNAQDLHRLIAGFWRLLPR